ncbi:MAG: R3H domain-containing nucleic acid-binding protein [Patescibacteria group bacterium]|nr:R3H domain-containing nucleic acid-binding protein [Patescibacteria group bacterium]
MLSQSNLEEIKKTIDEFFQKITFEVKIEFLPQKDLTLPINLKTEEPQILIGERGQTLAEIQHLLKAILKRKITEPFFIDLDINGYKKKKLEYLKELAHSVADEVALTKKEKNLPPMPAYERRIIHLELADRSDVTTESLGQGPERRVVVRPYF